MTKKDDVIKELTKIKGVGKKKAQSLYEEGFNSLDKLQKASVGDIAKVEGFSDKLASEIKDQFETAKPKAKPKAKKKEKEKTEEKKPKKKPGKKPKEEKEEEEAAEIAEEEEEYQVKKKPEVSTDFKHGLNIRKKIKNQKPVFTRQESFRYKRIPKNWRRPRGLHSKMRINKKYRPSRVRVGFRSPSKVRGSHPSGFEEVMVYNTKDLDKLNPKKQAARVGGTVGSKKRAEIQKKAEELDIRILNI